MEPDVRRAAPEPGSDPVPVPIHPEPVPDDPAVLRWVVPAGTLRFVGDPAGVPAPLRSLLDDGTLVEVTVDPDAVVLRAGAGVSWREVGPRVRGLLQAALATPAEWVAPAEDLEQPPADRVLARAVEQVIDGDVGDYVRGHGGRIQLLGVADGRVEVSLGGACSHCPASDVTLSQRFEVAVRARFPELREVVVRDEAPQGRRLLPLLAPRSRRDGRR